MKITQKREAILPSTNVNAQVCFKFTQMLSNISGIIKLLCQAISTGHLGF